MGCANSVPATTSARRARSYSRQARHARHAAARRDDDSDASSDCVSDCVSESDNDMDFNDCTATSVCKTDASLRVAARQQARGASAVSVSFVDSDDYSLHENSHSRYTKARKSYKL